MSARPVLRKRANRVRKLMRQQLPAQIDLVQWLQDHGHAQTAGEARTMLKDGRVKTQGGNILGRGMENVVEGDQETVRYYAKPMIAATLRGEIVVWK